MIYKQRTTWIQLFQFAVFAIYGLLQTVYCHSTYKRSVSIEDIEKNRGAILIKNGNPTSCECALIDNKAAFVAANCLDFTGGSLNKDIKYEIYFDGGNSQSPAKTSVETGSIIVHPFYNTKTFANNLAILQYDFTEHGNSWNNKIASYRAEWSDIAYVRRSIDDTNLMKWNSPKVESYSNIDDGCDKASTLYSKNTDTFYCSLIYTSSLSNSACNMPYGSIYGITSNGMGIAGIYSHSVVYGDDTCGGDKEYHYYTVLTNYLKYARSVLGRTPKEFVEDKDGLSNVRRIINYRMKWPTSANDNGTLMFGGDMLAIQKDSGSLIQSDSTLDSTETNDINDNDSHRSDTVDDNSSVSDDNDKLQDSKDKDDTGDDADIDANNGNISETDHHTSNIVSDNSDALDAGANSSDRDSAYTGPSKGAVIAMSVTIPLVVIVLAILAYVLFRKHRKKYPLGKWRKGTIKRKSTVRALIEEIGGASRPEVLPTYNDLYDMRTLTFQEQQVGSEQALRH